MLEFADKTLNQLPLSIPPFIIGIGCFGNSGERDRGLGSLGVQFIPKRLRTIAAISNQVIEIEVNSQIMRFDDVVALSRCQAQAQGIAQPI